jgi:ribonuclease E
MSDLTSGPPPAGPTGPSTQPSPGPADTAAPAPAHAPSPTPSVDAPASSATPSVSTEPSGADEPPGSGESTGSTESTGSGAASSPPPAGGGAGTSSGARRRRRPSQRPAEAAAGTGTADAPEPGDGAPPSSDADRTTAPVGAAGETQGLTPGAGPRIGDTRPPSAAPPKPRIGDTRPAPTPPPAVAPPGRGARSGSRPAPAAGPATETGTTVAAVLRDAGAAAAGEPPPDAGDEPKAKSGRSRRRSGRERRGRPVGRYMMCVHVRPHATQIAVLEGRTLVEHYVSRAADDTSQIDGNIYRGRVQNVLPGMEAAFIDIGTPKNAVLYRGDVRYDRDDIETPGGGSPRIEEMLRPGQTILTQVTKNPIGAKGARLTQEVSLPGRFVVMVPNSTAFGISKRLDDAERKRLRRIVDEVRPKGHGLIVRTAAEGASQDELRHDVDRLVAQWASIEAVASRSTAAELLYREPDLAVRIVREEFNRDYRGVVIDDEELFTQVRDYVAQVNPELVDRVEYYDAAAEGLPVFERFHVHEQLHKALDRKVWLPSGGSLIIERTEALTVIDVNTGKNVGKSNLEETVFRNNLEAAEEIARQLRLRDIGGIIVIDFIDMEIKDNRGKVAAALRAALARDKTRTQVFDISELGLVEMTRKRVSEGLVESLSTTCAVCGGRGIVLDETLL